jgi:hypothetical protein
MSIQNAGLKGSNSLSCSPFLGVIWGDRQQKKKKKKREGNQE